MSQSEFIKSEKIFQTYKELFPNELEFLIIYSLYKNRSKTFENFEYSEIKQTIVETSKLSFLTTGKQIQIERVFKNLLGTFIERVPGNFNLFILTPHAERLIEILVNRINNPYLKFPLKETFETYFQLPDNVKEDISHLQRWFKLGFQNTARQVVIGHLEGLKLAVDRAIKELNLVLETDDLSAIQMLESFSTNFQILGDKARQISEAIRMKDEIYYSLKDIVDIVIQEASSYKHPVTVEEKLYYFELEKKREVASSIKEEVYVFFDKVDKQLDLINSRLAFASFKIAELQESLRAQSHYKMSLKKILIFLLENGTSDIHGVILPDRFPKKDIPQQKFRFRTLRYWDMGFLRKGQPFEQNTDAGYEEEERIRFELELRKQELIQELCEKAQVDLSEAKRLDLSARLFEIMEQGNNIEIVVQTGYEFMRGITDETHIHIEEKIQCDKNNSLQTWKIILQNSTHLNS
jgi:hypothetical protein